MATTLRQRQRQRLQMRIFLIPAIPTLSLVCGSMLLVLALISIILTGSLLDDFDRFPQLKHPQFQSQSKAVNTNPRSKELEDVSTKGDHLRKNIWTSRFSEFYYGCSDQSRRFKSAIHDRQFKRYLMIAASGGLNQQRTGIIDAVVVAQMLNATLVVPKLDQKSFWKDKSNFEDIFDVDWFISSLSDNVKVVKELPEKIKKEVGKPSTMRVPRKCTQHCYENRVLPVLQKRHGRWDSISCAL